MRSEEKLKEKTEQTLLKLRTNEGKERRKIGIGRRRL
jgi:hypothetical protein